jgi:GT2 family glycosyltransferase
VVPDLDFSVVVPSRNRHDTLVRLLDALKAQEYPRESFEVVVVDDGSDPPLAGCQRKYEGCLQLSVFRENGIGCGPARQSGVDRARGTFLAFTDDDCVPAPGWLSALAEAHRRFPGCGIGGRTVNALTGNVFSETTQFVVELLITSCQQRGGEIRYSPTSNLSFPADWFRAIGGLDPAWSNGGGEDRDLCSRWLAAGFSLRYEPSAVVQHFHALTARQFANQHFRYGRGSRRFHSTHSAEGFEPWQFYVRLVTRLFREYPLSRALSMAGAVALSQAATCAGFFVEGFPNVRRP